MKKQQAIMPSSAALYYILKKDKAAYLRLIQAMQQQQQTANLKGLGFRIKLPHLPSFSDISDAVKKINSPSDIVNQVKKINSPSDIVDVVHDINSTIAHAVLPEDLLRQASDFEKKHRSEIKMAALIAAVVLTGGAAAQMLPNIISGFSGAATTTANAVRSVFATVMQVPGFQQAQQALTTIKTFNPTEFFSAQNIGDQMKNYVDKIGQQKFKELVAKYQKPNPTDQDVAAFSAALAEAATGTPTSASDVSSVLTGTPGTPWTAYALPLLTAGAAVIL